MWSALTFSIPNFLLQNSAALCRSIQENNCSILRFYRKKIEREFCFCNDVYECVCVCAGVCVCVWAWATTHGVLTRAPPSPLSDECSNLERRKIFFLKKNFLKMVLRTSLKILSFKCFLTRTVSIVNMISEFRVV